MSSDKTISAHYTHGDLLQAIRTSIAKLGKTVETITVDDLAPVDEFHIGGRSATEHFLGQLNLPDESHLLDIGCGLGGAARFIADKFGYRITGIDLTEEYIETGKALCKWVKLDHKITLQCGSALSMPFQNKSFDSGYMMHVGMNIDAKDRLFEEVHRVLRPNAVFAVYDVMRQNNGDLCYPVPWATQESTSKLASPDQYRQALINAGFKVLIENNRHQFAIDFFEKLQSKIAANDGPPPLGLHTLMRESTAEKIKNMITNITNGYIAPVEMIARKP